MSVIVDVLSVLVVVCMLGAMLFATKALRARKAQSEEEKKQNLVMAGYFFAGYALMNVLRLLAEGYLA